MRVLIKDFIELAANTLNLKGPIYEFGSYQVEEQGDFGNLRPYFPKKEFVGCDMREGPGVDKILNLHKIDLPSNSVGTVLIMDTLEHVEYPHKALDEIYRILKPDGIVIMSSVMNFPIHDYPYDYWRFTPEAFRSLLKKFQISYADYAGDKDFPHTVIGIGSKGDIKGYDSFIAEYQEWKPKWIDQLAPETIDSKLINIKNRFQDLENRINNMDTNLNNNIMIKIGKEFQRFKKRFRR